jgi:hypothetical protein
MTNFLIVIHRHIVGSSEVKHIHVTWCKIANALVEELMIGCSRKGQR